VTDRDIDDRMELLQASLGKEQYLVAEIFLPVDTMAQDADTLALAQRLTREILQNKAPFQKVAAQFSQGAAAARGGDLGWVQEGQLPDPLNALVATMKEGDLSQPARSLTGYHILLLRSKRVVQAENLPTRDQVMNFIGTERLDRLQRRYLMDLKAEAFVERRV
ncbi:MAG: peptidyl-prolyl cis-trans isomerase, partial [Micavibrio aeruginosavorus]|nr:peptidyl-prolyl cis-trans isomerase [Micavibrio aeruginosavorus]